MAIDPGFRDRYDAVMAKWPVPYEGVDLESRFGTTHINVCGAPGAPPVVLLPGGRSTSAVWYATVGALAQDHRVYAIDTLGDAGLSVRSDEPMRTLDAVVQWLDATFDGLGLATAALAGHSLGAHFAMRYAIHAPERISRLVLFDPTDCLSATPMRYYLRAVPLFVGRNPGRWRSFNVWESRGRVDPVFLDLWAGAWGGSSGGAMAEATDRAGIGPADDAGARVRSRGIAPEPPARARGRRGPTSGRHGGMDRRRGAFHAPAGVPGRDQPTAGGVSGVAAA